LSKPVIITVAWRSARASACRSRAGCFPSSTVAISAYPARITSTRARDCINGARACLNDMHDGVRASHQQKRLPGREAWGGEQIIDAVKSGTTRRSPSGRHSRSWLRMPERACIDQGDHGCGPEHAIDNDVHDDGKYTVIPSGMAMVARGRPRRLTRLDRDPGGSRAGPTHSRECRMCCDSLRNAAEKVRDEWTEPSSWKISPATGWESR
jgi:hypothetical protein